jgi:oligopeptide/dipeptide ABC transporter ATP-binding protein
MTAPATVPRGGKTGSLVASVQNLQVHFDTKAGLLHAVDGVSFDIADGETLGLVGETGCGKSVTARSFLRLIPTPPGRYAGGRIEFWPKEARVAGGPPVDLLSIPSADLLDIRGNRIAMIFQDPGKALNPALPIREQVAEVFYQHRSDELLDEWNGDASPIIRRAAQQRSGKFEWLAMKVPPLRSQARRLRRRVDEMVADALAETQIPNPRKIMASYPHELSGGMKQRVMIAQALACNPDLLIADEPTTALDVTIQAKILELIRDLQERHQTSVLYISHDLSLVRRVCDRIAVMYAGRIAEIGTTDEVFHDPRHPYTQGLLAAIPSFAHQRGELAAIEGTVPELIDPTPGCRFSTRCDYATEICHRIDPVLDGGGDTRRVACHAYATPEELGVDAAELPRVVRSAP